MPLRSDAAAGCCLCKLRICKLRICAGRPGAPVVIPACWGRLLSPTWTLALVVWQGAQLRVVQHLHALQLHVGEGGRGWHPGWDRSG